MGKRAKELAGSFVAFNGRVIAYVANCSDRGWGQICPAEGWTVGVVAHHIAARHYDWLRLAKIIAAGEEVADMSMDAIHQVNAKHAREQAACTQDQVLNLLRKSGGEIVFFLNRLDDAALERTIDFSLVQGTIGIRQVIEWLIIHMGEGHLSSMMAVAAV